MPVAGALNYEASPSYTLVVRVTDSRGLSTFQTITVNVLDLNEAADFTLVNAATIPQTVTELSISKAATPVGTSVGTLTVTDQDAGPAGTVGVTLADGSKGASPTTPSPEPSR